MIAIAASAIGCSAVVAILALGVVIPFALGTIDWAVRLRHRT